MTGHERIDQALAALRAATPERNSLGLYGPDKDWGSALVELDAATADHAVDHPGCEYVT